MEGLKGIFDNIMSGVPSVVMALLLAILTWIIAGIVRKIIVKGGSKLKLPAYFKKMHVVQDEEKGYDLLKTLGSLGFFIVFLIMIPSVLDSLGMQSVSAPLTDMVANGLAFIPNLLGAGIVVFVGYLLSKIAKEVVTGIAKTLGLDKLASKISGMEDSEYSLSEVLGNVVFALIIIPTIITALQTLQLDAVAKPAAGMLNSMFAIVPNVIVSVIMIVLGLFIAKVVGEIVRGFFVNSGVDKLADKEQVKVMFSKYKPSVMFTGIVKFVIIAIFFFEAVAALNLTVLTNIINAVLLYVPNILGAAIILLVAYFAAMFISSLVTNVSGSKLLGTIIKVLVYVFAIFMTLNQLALAPQIVSVAFMFTMGALALAFVIAFGMGGRDFAKKQLEKLDKKISE